MRKSGHGDKANKQPHKRPSYIPRILYARCHPPAAMAPPWADLTPDLLIQVAHRLDDLKSYVGARGACKPWRRALVPPFPALLVAAEDEHTMSLRRPTATSLATRKPFQLAAISSGCRCVGSSNGWLALCIRVKHRSAADSSDYNCYHTAFFLVNPVAGLEIELPPLFEENRTSSFAAVAICNGVRIIYVTARATSWAVHDFKIKERDQFVDLVYHGEGNKVYCLTRSADVHILHLPKRRLSCRHKPAIVEALPLPLLLHTPPCRVPGVFGRRRRVNLGEMFVLRYYPDRWPCWDVVKDLGGYSFFVGKNNAVSLYAKGMPGLRGNCVYWIDRHGREKGIIFDVQTGRSTPCQSPEAAVDTAPHRYKRTISFWYFLRDVVTTNS
ncbi:hypothetical protein HU200_050308 [Digitaria exilis]|uniref:KIB1-4 beta-propeller domain-containing protein n=1 Tax=Digitaria exilis TaxID=1010633 RepID=A0A835EBE6_9POAL|nr:hypothetical protein HU200_050308 [Digitaria exilis]